MLDKNKSLAIFAGNGILPKILINECEKIGRKFFIFQLKGQKYDIDYSKYNPVVLAYGEIERFLGILRQNNVSDMVFIGSVIKPNFSNLKVDKKGTILLAKILANKILGDDAVLRTVLNFFKKEGFKIWAIDELIDCVFVKKEVLTIIKPNSDDIFDINLGRKAIGVFSKFDVGQSIIVAQKQIIAIEAVEGTDTMISRCKDLNIEYKDNAILVKTKKHNQTRNADLPTIGVKTIENCKEAGIKGIAIESKSTLVLEKELVVKKADELGLFITVI